jgi:ribosomal protein S18 acetylase RimI-like enzyme
MNLNITEAGTSDASSIVQLVNSAYRGDEARKGWTHEADLIEGEKRIDENSVRQLLADPFAKILLYRNEQKLLGCVYLQQRNDLVYMGMLSVQPDTQAKGIGKQLLQAAEEFALEKHCLAIEMTVISSRKELIRWYEKYGYVVTDETRPFPTDDRFGRPREKVEFAVLVKTL